MQFCSGATVRLDSLGYYVSTPLAVSEVLDVQCLCIRLLCYLFGAL